MKATQIKKLRSQLVGPITGEKAVRDYFSTDGSIFSITPSAVIYPDSSKDVQAAVKYAAEQTQKGHAINLVGRGRGTDQSGGALGDGVMLAFPARMNKLRRLTKDTVTVQPGMIFGALQSTLYTHGRFLPPYPASVDYSTVGGAVANNAGGEKSLKYGTTARWVKSLKVVLDDGSEIETRRLNRWEVNRKKGQMTREGEIYRSIDGLIQDNSSLIKQAQPQTSKNSAGYRLGSIKGRDGSLDLTQLFVGSQGTLGLITEITFATAHYEPRTTLITGFFDSLEKASTAIMKVRKLGPSAIEMVDSNLLEYLRQHRPDMIEGLVPDEIPAAMLLVEFDNGSHLRQNMLGRRAERIISKHALASRNTTNRREQSKLWNVRRSAADVMWTSGGAKKALPIIEDACVPLPKLTEFLEGVYKILKKHKLQIAVWGHGGDANFHLQPFLDLSKAKDQKAVFTVMDEFYTLVLKLGGTTAGEHNDGLLRAPYLERLYGREVYRLFREVKQICDPQGIFNPSIKLGVTKKDLEKLLREEYSMKHLHDYLPHS